MKIPLSSIAHARSGDKGDTSNIAVFAYAPELYPLLVEQLTAERFKAFYGGGAGSVRGYEAGSLGPRDIYGNSLGGKRKIIGNAEIFYPILKGDRSVRISAFADAGQIYANGYQPEFENFRFSAGLGLAWNSPIGPLKFSYAIPFNDIPEDKIQKFQFQVGTVF